MFWYQRVGSYLDYYYQEYELINILDKLISSFQSWEKCKSFLFFKSMEATLNGSVQKMRA